MLPHPKLVFPHLQPLNQNAVFEKNKQQIPLYKLDWTRLKQQHIGHGLPDPWDSIFESELFAPPPTYLSEIRFQCQQASLAWERALLTPLPQTLHNVCKEPAAAHTLAAFAILADALYDPVTHHWCRSWIKYATASTLALKFWGGYAPSKALERSSLSSLLDPDPDLDPLDRTQLRLLYHEIKEFVSRKIPVVQDFDLDKAKQALEQANQGPITTYTQLMQHLYRHAKNTSPGDGYSFPLRTFDDPLIQELASETPEPITQQWLHWDETNNTLVPSDQQLPHSQLPGDQDR